MQISHVVPLLNLLTIAKAGDWILVARATIRAAIMGRSTLTQFVNRPAFETSTLVWSESNGATCGNDVITAALISLNHCLWFATPLGRLSHSIWCNNDGSAATGGIAFACFGASCCIEKAAEFHKSARSQRVLTLKEYKVYSQETSANGK